MQYYITLLTLFNNMILSERIQKLLDYAEMNPTQFSRKVGFPTAQTIRELLKGNTKSVSEAVKFKINNSFPEINLDWLVSGEGDMFISEPEPTSDFYDEWVRRNRKNDTGSHVQNVTKDIGKLNSDSDYVPLLPVEAMAGSLQGFSDGITLRDCRKIKSPVNGADWAIQISGDSMEPEYRNGSYIFIKKMTGSFIPWGHTMVLDTRDGVVVKNIFPVDGADDIIEARSINTKYPPFKIETSCIIGIYRVLGGSFINSTI